MAPPIDNRPSTYANSRQWAVDKTEQLAYQYGPVPSSAYRDKTLLKRYIDFKTVADLETWMSSPLFKPYFDRLFKMAIEPRMRLFPGTPGPTLKDIKWEQPKKDFWIGSTPEEELLTNRYFDETDNYAYCLYSLCKVNKFKPGGCFHGKDNWMKDSDVEARIWAAIQCATIDRRAAGSKQTKRIEAESLADGEPSSAPQTLKHPGSRNNFEEVTIAQPQQSPDPVSSRSFSPQRSATSSGALPQHPFQPNKRQKLWPNRSSRPRTQVAVRRAPSIIPNSPQRSLRQPSPPLNIEANLPALAKPMANTSASKKRTFIEMDFEGVEFSIEMKRGRIHMNVDENNRLISGEIIVGGGEQAAEEKVVFKIKTKVEEGAEEWNASGN